MDFKKYFSESQTVTVSVAKLGNQKITKSIFTQIPIGRRIKYPFDFEGINIKILGFVNDKEHWVIYTENELLYRGSLREIYKTLSIRKEDLTIGTITYYIDIANPEDYDDYDSLFKLPENEQAQFQAILDRMRLFYTSLKNYQIYL